MNRWPPLPPSHPLASVLERLLNSDRVLSREGVGGNLVEAIYTLAAAADRLAASIERFTGPKE